MASHHHHQYQQHQHQHQHSYPSCNGCCCNNNPSSFPPFPSPPPPPVHHQSHLHTVVDPLIVQSIATQILQSSQNHHLYPPHQYLEQPPPPPPPPPPHKQQQTRSLLTSLLRRIDALESSLHNLSVSPSPPPPPPPRRLSLRDLAARTIQIHFRAFLVRRSRTLRNLKDLAFIKSSFNHLKSSLSGSNNLDSHALSQKAMDLLLKLDSVQGGDPMIRDGKRSISKQLVQFLEYVDGISVKRKQISSKDNQESRARDQSSRRVAAAAAAVDNKISSNRQVLGRNFTVHLKKVSDDQDDDQGFSRVSEDDDDEESQVEFDGFHPSNDQEEIPRNVNYRKGDNSHGISMKRQEDLSLKPKKSVSFADNNNGEKNSRAFLSNTQEEPFSSEDGDSSIDQLSGVSGDDNNQRELVEHLCREVEEIGGFSRVSEDDDEEEDEEEPQLVKRGLSQVSDGERNPREYVKTEVNHGLSRHGGFVFSPPKPVQMEPRKNNSRIVR